MRKLLLLLALAGAPALPAWAQNEPATTVLYPVSLESALDTLVKYQSTGAKIPEDVLAALNLVSTAIAKPESLPVPVKARLDTLLAEKHPVPSPKNPVKQTDPLSFLLVRYENRLLDATPVEKITAYRGAEFFPGAVGEGAVPISKTVTLNSGITGRHSLGLYAAPGARITVTLEGKPEEIAAHKLQVQIGAHSDNLYTAPGGRDKAQRLPSVVRFFPVEGAKTLAANPVGGLVYIVVPTGTIPGKLPFDHNDKPKTDSVKVRIEGAVASPLYELGKTTPEDWRQQLANSKAPWAELASPYLVLTVNAEDAKAVADPAVLMTEWSRIGKSFYSLIGYPENHVPIRPERYVCDVQISAGAAHAGYPLVLPMSWAKRYTNPQDLKTGNNWGLYHELGHNFQDPNWSFANNGEVTCNLFVFLVRKGLYGEPAWEDKHLQEVHAKLKEFLDKGANPWESGDNFSRLLFWYDLTNGLGFEPFQKTFGETKRSAAPEDEKEKRVLLLTRLSKASGKNLGPYFVKWGVVEQGDVPASLNQYPMWLPEGWPTA